MLSALAAFLRRVPIAVEQDEDERHDDAAPAAVADLDVRDGWLVGQGVTHDASPKHSRSPLLERRGPALVVTHCTSTLHGTAPALLRAIRNPAGREASWHVLLDEHGGIVQSISFTRAAWHAGSASAARVVIDGKLVAVNACSVGIELINAGPVKRAMSPRGLPVWRAWPYEGDAKRKPGPIVPDDQVVEVGGRWYQAYTAAQWDAWLRVMRALLEAHPRLLGPVTLVARDGRRSCVPGWRVGHVDIDPARKADPHASWNWPTP